MDIFMVEILVCSILKLIQALLARLSDNMELKSEFHHFCLSIAISGTLFFSATQIFSLAKCCLMLVLLRSTTRLCWWAQLKKMGAKTSTGTRGHKFGDVMKLRAWHDYHCSSAELSIVFVLKQQLTVFCNTNTYIH